MGECAGLDGAEPGRETEGLLPADLGWRGTTQIPVLPAMNPCKVSTCPNRVPARVSCPDEHRGHRLRARLDGGPEPRPVHSRVLARDQEGCQQVPTLLDVLQHRDGWPRRFAQPYAHGNRVPRRTAKRLLLRPLRDLSLSKPGSRPTPMLDGSRFGQASVVPVLPGGAVRLSPGCAALWRSGRASAGKLLRDRADQGKDRSG